MGLNPMPERERCPGCGADASHASAHRHPTASLPPHLDPEVRAHYDGVLFWSCNQCGQTWHHWDLTSRLHHIAEKYMTAPPNVASTTGEDQHDHT